MCWIKGSLFGALLDSLIDSCVAIVFVASLNYTAIVSLLVGRIIAMTEARYSNRRIARPQCILPSVARCPIRKILRRLAPRISGGYPTRRIIRRRYATFSGGYQIRRISPPSGYPTISGMYPFRRVVRPSGLSPLALNSPLLWIPRPVRTPPLAAGSQFAGYSVRRIAIP